MRLNIKIKINGTINMVSKLKNEPYAYKDKNGEPIGADVDFIYIFAKQNGYKINLLEVNTYDEQIEFLKNTVGNFLIRNDKKEEITFTNVFHPSGMGLIVRYEDLPESNEWKGFYESVKKYEGKKTRYTFRFFL